MATKTKKFDNTGAHSLAYNRYYLEKALEAVADGLPANQGDFTYKTLASEIPRAVEACAKDHPGPDGTKPGQKADHPKLARENAWRQAKKFITWLETGAGKSAMLFSAVVYSLSHSFVVQDIPKSLLSRSV